MEKKVIYKNSLGEEFYDGTHYYFYDISNPSGPPSLLKAYVTSILTHESKFLPALIDGWTEAGATPGSALYLLNEYYKKYGYPDEKKL